jgi:hypothetical protein
MRKIPKLGRVLTRERDLQNPNLHHVSVEWIDGQGNRVVGEFELTGWAIPPPKSMTPANPNRFGPPWMDWDDLWKATALADAFAEDLLVVKYVGRDHYNLLWLKERESEALREKFVVLHVSPASTAGDVRLYQEDAWARSDDPSPQTPPTPAAPAKSNKRRRRS